MRQKNNIFCNQLFLPSYFAFNRANFGGSFAALCWQFDVFSALLVDSVSVLSVAPLCRARVVENQASGSVPVEDLILKFIHVFSLPF